MLELVSRFFSDTNTQGVEEATEESENVLDAYASL